MTARRLVLWRHGRTAWNATQRFQGQLDAPLDDVGRVQAKEAAAVLASILAGSEPIRLVTSDLSRAADTAAELAALLGTRAEPDPALREVHGGDWQGLYRDELLALHQAEYSAWLRGDDEHQRTGRTGETRAEAGARVHAAIETHDAACEGGTLVVTSHGAALRAALQLLLDLPPTAAPAFGALGNAHWAELTPRPTGRLLRAWNVGVHPDPVPPQPTA